MRKSKPLDWQDTLPFGKFRGEIVGKIFDENPGYLDWMMNSTEVRFASHVAIAIGGALDGSYIGLRYEDTLSENK